jgi:hypothetical protein
MLSAGTRVGNVSLAPRLEAIIVSFDEHLLRRDSIVAWKVILGRPIRPQRQIGAVIDPTIMVRAIVGKTPTIARPRLHDVVSGGVAVMVSGRVAMVLTVAMARRRALAG